MCVGWGRRLDVCAARSDAIGRRRSVGRAVVPGRFPGSIAGWLAGWLASWVSRSNVSTEQATLLAFTPNTLTAPANTSVTVNYNNNSNQPHNIQFFNGSDSSAPSLGATEVATGPNALRSVTFTTPAQPGTYFFWCDVHTSQMAGTLQVQ